MCVCVWVRCSFHVSCSVRLRAGHPLGKPAVLFHAIEEETVLAFKAKVSWSALFVFASAPLGLSLQFAGNQASRQEQNA